MPYAILRDSAPELLNGAFVDNNNVQHPAAVLDLWTPEELETIEVYPVVRDPLPSDLSTQEVADQRVIWDPESRIFRLAVILRDIPLPVLKERKIQELHTACQEQITGGFVSAALGDTHVYSSKLEDQINLMGAAISAPAQGIGYVCTNADQIKMARIHSPDQIKQVYADGVAHKSTAILQFHLLREQVESAKSAADIVAITWDQTNVR